MLALDSFCPLGNAGLPVLQKKEDAMCDFFIAFWYPTNFSPTIYK